MEELIDHILQKVADKDLYILEQTPMKLVGCVYPSTQLIAVLQY